VSDIKTIEEIAMKKPKPMADLLVVTEEKVVGGSSLKPWLICWQSDLLIRGPSSAPWLRQQGASKEEAAKKSLGQWSRLWESKAATHWGEREETISLTYWCWEVVWDPSHNRAWSGGV
jgi:hypothetical protein